MKSALSTHTVILHDPENKWKFPRPLHLDRLKVAYVRQPTPSNYFSVVTHEPEVVYTSTGTQILTPDIYAQDTEINSVERSELSSQDVTSNVEMHGDMYSLQSSSERIISELEAQSSITTPEKSKEIETQSQTPMPLKSPKIETQSQIPSQMKSQEIETHEESPSVIQEPVPKAETHMENTQSHNLRPKCTIRKPKRYCDSGHVDLKNSSVSSDNEFYRIKRV